MRNRYHRQIEGGGVQLMIEVSEGCFVNELYAVRNHMALEEPKPAKVAPSVQAIEINEDEATAA